MQYAPHYGEGGYGLEPRAFYVPPRFEAPEEGIVAAYAFYYDDARSCVNLAEPGAWPLTAVGAPGYFRDRIGATCNGSNYFQSAIPSSDDMTLIAIAGVVRSLNSAGNAAMISNYNGNDDLAPVGDELSFAAFFDFFTGAISGHVLTVSAFSYAPQPLEVGSIVQWGDDEFDIIVGLGSGSGGTGSYMLEKDNGTVASTAMKARCPQVRCVSQRRVAGSDGSLVSVTGEADGARGLFAATMSAAGGNAARVFKAIGGGLAVGAADTSPVARAPVTGVGGLRFGANYTGGGDEVRMEMALVLDRALTAGEVGRVADYLRSDFLPDWYSVPPTW